MLEVKSVHKAFDGVDVVEDVNLSIANGTLVTILAPSGAGKTTLLRLISGLVAPTSGSIILDEKLILGPSPEIGFVFQETSIFPWLKVKENIVFGTTLRANASKVQHREEAVSQLCRDLGIQGLGDRYPSQLSGGQKQRVVIARSLILRPKLLLFDEPFTSLDEITRQGLCQVLIELQHFYRPTILFVTHNVQEALLLGQHVLICSGPPLRVKHQIGLSFKKRTDALTETGDFASLKEEVQKLIRVIH